MSAVFLDRDGTLMQDSGYPCDPEAVRLVDGSAEALGRLNRAGVPVIVVTNQSGIGRGIVTPSEAAAVERALTARLAERSARVDAVYVCPHAPAAGCGCRKPAGDLYEQAAADLALDLATSLYVGDRLRDVAAASRWGGLGALVRTGATLPEMIPDGVWVADDLAEVVERAISLTRPSSSAAC